MSNLFSVLCDLDGVLHRESKPIPGAARFVKELQASGRQYLFLTNSPDQSPQQLEQTLKKFGMHISAEHFYTAARAVAEFLACHAYRPRVFVIGSEALRTELKRQKAVLTDHTPDFVVFGSGGEYRLSLLDKAVKFVRAGAKLIAVNAEQKALTETGFRAGCGALLAPIEIATETKAYIVGKPNHFMIRAAERCLSLKPSETLMIGDSLDTDIDVGMQAQMKTILVLTGITSRKDVEQSSYRPDYIFESVGRIKLNKLP